MVVVLLATTFSVLFGASRTASATDNYPTPAPVLDAEFEPRWALPGPTIAAAIDAKDVVSDADGNFYLLGSSAVTKLAPNGDTLLNWGSQGSAPGQLQGAQDIAIHEASGQAVLYVLDTGNCRVQKFTPSGGFLGMFGLCSQARAEYAYSVAPAGDVNGDGYDDIIVGAPFHDGDQPDEGRAFLYLGTPEGPSITAAWIADGDQLGAQFGSSVASAGDVNGDGYDDVIVGAPSFDAGHPDEGRAYVYFGSSSGLSASAAWIAEGDQAAAAFGSFVSSAGDVNGDGFNDVLVGAPAYDGGQLDEGAVFLWLGGASGLGPNGSPTDSDWTTQGDQDGARFGGSVSSAGDVNGDGYHDVIVGAHLYDGGQVDEGKAFVYLGSSSGISASPAWTAEADQTSAFFGWAVASAGDTNADGYDDVLVSAPTFDEPDTDEGVVRLYSGTASGLTSIPTWSAGGNQAGTGFGSAVASAGDVNGDGYDDVIVGAQWFDAGQTDEGKAFAFAGSALGPGLAPAWTAESHQAAARFGGSTTSAGDANGDGYDDVIVGARWFDAGDTDDGQAFLWFGASSGLGPNGDPAHVDTVLPPALHFSATGLAVSPQTGHVYVGPSGHMQAANIYHFLPDGRMVSEWPVPSSFRSAGVAGLAFDPAGDLWAAIEGGIWFAHASVAHYTTDGVQIGDLWFVDGATCPAGGGGLNNLIPDVMVDAGGVYLISSGNSRIEKYTYEGTCILSFGAPTSSLGNLGEADTGGGGLGVSPSGEILNGWNNALRIWTPAGAHVRTIVKPDTGFWDLLVDEARNTIYVLTTGLYYGPVIRRYDLSGHMKGYWTDRGRYSSGYHLGVGRPMAIDSEGNVYATIGGGFGGSIVRKFSPFGDPLRDFGFMCSWIGPVCNGTPGELSGARGIAVDTEGNVYVADSDEIKVFSPSGTPSRTWGGTGSAPGQFQFSYRGGALEFGPDGLLYVVDDGNGRIQVFDPASGAFIRSWGPMLDPSNPVLGTMAPYAIDFREHPNLGELAYVAHDARLLRFSPTGRFLGDAMTFQSPSAGARDLEYDPGGDLYLTEEGTGRMTRWQPTAVPPGEPLLQVIEWVPSAVAIGDSVDGFVFIANLGSGVATDLSVGVALPPDAAFEWATPSPEYNDERNTLAWLIDPIPPGGSSLQVFRYVAGGRPTDEPVSGRARSIIVVVDPPGNPINYFVPPPPTPDEVCNPGAVLESMLRLVAAWVLLVVRLWLVETQGLALLLASEIQFFALTGIASGGWVAVVIVVLAALTFLLSSGLVGREAVRFSERVQCFLTPYDPNQKGPDDVFVRPGAPVLFPIHFENIGDVAARDVRIEDPLDPSLGAPISVSPGGVYNEETRILNWDLIGRNLQPSEGDTVFFVAATDATVASGTVISNQASIIFDFNPPMQTNMVRITVDGQPPRSRVEQLPDQSQPNLLVSWASDDFGLSGVGAVTLFVSEDHGPFAPFHETGEATGTRGFTGENGRTYCFVSQARDRLFNIEVLRDMPDTCTTVVLNSPPIASAGSDQVVEVMSLAGALVTLDASGSSDPNNDPLEFAWLIAGEIVATGPNPTIVLPVGVHAVTLVVTDPGGLFAGDTVQITVVAPDLEVTKTASAVVNVGEAITVTIDYVNVGGADAVNVEVVETLPLEVAYVAGSASPAPDNVAVNPDGTTTLIWSVGTVVVAGGGTITFTARPSLLLVSPGVITNAVEITFEGAYANAYPTEVAVADTALAEVTPQEDVRNLGWWKNHQEEITGEIRGMIQATDTRYDLDRDGVLGVAEVDAALQGVRPEDRVSYLRSQLLVTYLNLATRAYNAGTDLPDSLDGKTAMLGLDFANVREAALFARDVLERPLDSDTDFLYVQAFTTLAEINTGWVFAAP